MSHSTTPLPAKLSEDDIHARFGRELLPGKLADAFLRASNMFSQGGTDKKSPAKIWLNTSDKPISLAEADAGAAVLDRRTPADSYYMVEHSYIHKGTTDGPMYFTPYVTISVGLAHNLSSLGAETIASVTLDTRKKDDIEIEYAIVENIGLSSCTTFDQKIAIIGLMRQWMDRIDAGGALDPVKCRDEVKQATGLADCFGKWTCPQTHIDVNLRGMRALTTRHQSTRQSETASHRLKQLYALRRK